MEWLRLLTHFKMIQLLHRTYTYLFFDANGVCLVDVEGMINDGGREEEGLGQVRHDQA